MSAASPRPPFSPSKPDVIVPNGTVTNWGRYRSQVRFILFNVERFKGIPKSQWAGRFDAIRFRGISSLCPRNSRGSLSEDLIRGGFAS